MTGRGHERVSLGGAFLSRLTKGQVIDELGSWIAAGRTNRYITPMNASKLAMMRHDEKLARCVRGSSATIADGYALYLASRLVGSPVPERVTGIDLMEAVLAEAEERGWGLYFLGASQEVLDAFLARCRREHPALKIAGARNGYFSRGEEGAVVAAIAGSDADILFLGLGLPQKEHFIVDHGADLNVGAILPVGGGFDVYGGFKKRAPAWVQSLGVEWLWRSVYDPSRARLVLRSAGPFLAILTREILRQRAGIGRGN